MQRQTQEEFLAPVIERGQRFAHDFARKFFQAASLDKVIDHLTTETVLGQFPQLEGVVRERMQAFLADFELGTPVRYPNARTD